MTLREIGFCLAALVLGIATTKIVAPSYIDGRFSACEDIVLKGLGLGALGVTCTKEAGDVYVAMPAVNGGVALKISLDGQKILGQ